MDGKEVTLMCRGRKWFLLSLLAIMVMIMTLAVAVEQGRSQIKYPTRAIDILSPVSPGGSLDLNARLIGAYFRKKFGVPANVINKPGGNMVPACLELHNAGPDGYTLLGDSLPSTTMMKASVKNLPFKMMDRTFVAQISIDQIILLVPSTSPFKTLKDLEAEAKRSPETFTWTSVGGSSLQDFVSRQFLKAIGVDVLKTKPVIVTGGAQSAVLTAGGHVVMGVCAVPSGLPAIRAGTVRPLAVTGKARWPDLPDLPTTAEVGYPTVKAINWNGLSGPPKMPPYIVEILDKALQEMVRDPDIISKMRNVGSMPFYRNASALKEFIMEEDKEVEELWRLR